MSAKETWITIKQNNNYEISNFGNVRNKKTQRKNAIKNNLGKYHILGNEVTKKKIGQYDKNNNLIKKYESISEASRQTGITVASISYSANGIRKSGGGYLWHFV